MSNTCTICGGPVVIRDGIPSHSNATGFYAGQQMDHDAEVADNDLKIVTLGFRVPAGVDLPSERLAAMKDLLLDALAEKLAKHTTGALRMSDERVTLARVLLTES